MLTGADGRTRLRSARGTRGTPGRWRGLAWTVALAVALAALFALSLSQSLTGALNSDGASNILQAQAMLHGNPLLRGWWTSDVSFYTTELPEYALVVALRGLSPDVVHICGALTYTLTVALAGLLARGRASGAAGLRRAGLAVAIMLAPSVLGGTSVFLENPDHFGTSVPVLLLLLLLDWGEGRDEVTAPRWYAPVAACALLAWTQVGDELSLAAATVPLAAVCAFRLAATLLHRRPRVGLRWDGLRWDGLLAAAALISVEVGRMAERSLRSIGGFDQRAIPSTRLASLDQIPGNARVLWQSIVLLFGANRPGTGGRGITISRHLPLAAMADLHLIGLAVAVAGLLAGLAAGFAGGSGRLGRLGRLGWLERDRADRDRVNQILVVSIGVIIAAGLFCTLMRSLTSAHEVAILLPLGAVLTGRTLPPLARELARALARRVRRPAVRLTTVVTAATVALAGWLAVGVAETGYDATWPTTPVPVQNVAAWLVAHHQYDGLAAYWQATQTTVTSGGRVLVAPVTNAGTAPRRWEASSAWYRPSRHRATFVIAEADPVYAEDSLLLTTARARFGTPAAEYNVGGHIIMIYHYNLLTRLRDQAFPGPS